jgi:thiamine-monophosphate kinase
LDEFDLIARIRKRAPVGDRVAMGIGDDAAILACSQGEQIAATTDNLVAGRHFRDCGPDAATPEEIGHLALAVNLSDLAAMGARPRWSLLSLTLPDASAEWLDGFLDGYLALATRHDCALVGGNLARGPMNIAVTALGTVADGQFATRQGARPGDRIVVTGSLGDAAAALALSAGQQHPLRRRLLRPAPRIEPGVSLARQVHAMIDISDGLITDLSHLLDGLGAELECERLPASDALIEAVPDAHRRWSLQFAGGDYELLALMPAKASVPESIDNVALTEIGRITETADIRCIDRDGDTIDVGTTGWDHFRDPSTGELRR